MLLITHRPPVKTDGQQGEHGQGDAQKRHEVVHLAENRSEYPDSWNRNLSYLGPKGYLRKEENKYFGKH